jgi:hypothetical protein
MTPADDTLITLKDACEIFFRGKHHGCDLESRARKGQS